MTCLNEFPMHKPAAILDGLGVSEVVLNDVRWVIDVGINRLENGKLVGDVDFEAVS
jgi:5,10-methylene-tetrahydrofolate dehydrogenase/methenyl tetrahydrofolate cyclohydrolase